jgi:AcrR family transcriptional regulator
MSLREEHRLLTRRTILTTVLDLVADGSIDELSVPAVARRSGVSLATIYRYFPTKDALLAAAADEPAREALAADAGRPVAGDDELAAFQRTMWRRFAGNLPLLRHQVTSQAGREMRQARLERSRQQLAGYLAGFGITPSSPDGARLTSLLLLLSGSLALVELHDRQGLAVDDAVDASQWAVQALIAATVGDQPGPHRTPEQRTAHP